MTIPAPTMAYLKGITHLLSDICLDLYTVVDKKTLDRLNRANMLIGKMKSQLDEDKYPAIPVYSDVNALAEALKRRREADEQAWKEILHESAKRQ